jgi:hypothetical protein
MGFSFDKPLKIDKHLGTVYLSTEPHLIKIINTSLSENRRANEIVIETAKSGKVTAAVGVMSIYCEKRCNLQSAYSGNEKLSCQKAESANSPEKKNHGLRKLSLKTRKSWLPKKLAPKSKKLELNSTNLKLKSKRICSDCTKKPDPSVR